MSVRLLAILVLLMPACVFADRPKNFSIGFGTYGLAVAYDNQNYTDDRLAGLSVSASYAYSDKFGFRATYFSLDHNDIAALNDSGIDLVAYIGGGLQSTGLKAYIGGGLFSESWDYGGISDSFGGLQISGGIGYNWDSLALDLVAALREPGDYEDALLRNTGQSVNAAAASAALIFSARF